MSKKESDQRRITACMRFASLTQMPLPLSKHANRYLLIAGRKGVKL